MIISNHHKKYHLFIFSITFNIIILVLVQNIHSYPSISFRYLKGKEKYKETCDNTLKDFKNLYLKSFSEINIKDKNETLNKYQTYLKEIIFEKNSQNLTKYIPRLIVYLIVAIIDFIFIILWIIFCCYCCKKEKKHNSIGCGGKCSFLIFFIFSIGVIAISLIGIITYPNHIKKINGLNCSMYKLVDHFLNGTEDNYKNYDWYGLNEISEILNNNEGQSNLNSTINNVNSLILQFENVNKETLDNLGNSEKLNSYISSIIFGGVLFFNLLTLISIFFIFICDCKCMNCFFHFFWNLQIILIIATFLLSSFIGSFSLVSKDLATILKVKAHNITNEDFIFNITYNKDVINLCLNEDGNYYNYLFKDAIDVNDLKGKDGSPINKENFNCTFFKYDYNILVNELKDRISKSLFFISLLLIIIGVAGMISIFFGITVYNNQKEYYPPPEIKDMNVNIYNNRNQNNRVDLSTENLKRQNNDVIFNNNYK